MSKYNKLIVAVIGLLVLVLGPDFVGISADGTLFGIPQDTAVQLAIAILTAAGVYQVSNSPA